MIRTCQSSDESIFFRAWLRNPLGVASVAPSSRHLAELITSEISARTGPVLELGPGTGVFTDALVGRGVPEAQLTLIEQHEGFAFMLQGRFPAANVLRCDASRLHRHVTGGQTYGAVVSGLPLLSMPAGKVLAIMASSFRLMHEAGSFYQFTYGPRCPVPRRILDRLGLTAVRIGWTPNNMPPAAVYRIARQSRA